MSTEWPSNLLKADMGLGEFWGEKSIIILILSSKFRGVYGFSWCLKLESRQLVWCTISGICCLVKENSPSHYFGYDSWTQHQDWRTSWCMWIFFFSLREKITSCDYSSLPMQTRGREHHCRQGEGKKTPINSLINFQISRVFQIGNSLISGVDSPWSGAFSPTPWTQSHLEAANINRLIF